MRFDLRESFFLNRSHHHFVSLRARRVEHKEGKLAITGDEAKFFVLNGHEVGVDLDGCRVSLALRIKKNRYAPRLETADRGGWGKMSENRRRTPEQHMKIICVAELLIAKML